MAGDPTNRNVTLLAVCQALAMSCNTMVVAISALVGQSLAPDGSLATLPFALQFVGVIATTAPASLLMARFGRRFGFSLGSFLGITAGLLSAFAILEQSFLLFCAGSVVFGMFGAHAAYYRFAAADTAGADAKGRAISLVMAGGVVAAIAGPELAKWSRDLFEPLLFAGSFLAISVLAFATLVIVQFIRIPPPHTEAPQGPARPLWEIARQPAFMVAVLAAMIGYGAMNLIMTATPLAMLDCDLTFNDSAFVIQWHVLGMFAPSFFTGHLIRRFGVERILLVGALAIVSCVVVNLTGNELLQFWAALVLLGLGWNFLYIGGNTLLTTAYLPAEKGKAQALNEFLTFGMVAATALSSGAIFHGLGWDAVNLAILLPIGLVAAAVLWLLKQRQTAPA